MRVKAGYTHYPIPCAMCHEPKMGRVYTIDQFSLPDPMSDGWIATGSPTICESCRGDFTHADFELDAPDMERIARQRDEEDALEPEGGKLLNEPGKHMTFKGKG